METPADPDSRQDLLTKLKAEPYSFIDPDKPTLYMPKDPQVSRSEVGMPRSKTARKKMKAPEYAEDGDQDGSGWSIEDLKYLYHRKELRDLVRQVLAMKNLKLKRIDEPKDPVTAPAILTNKIDAVTVLIKLLKEAGMIADPVSSPQIDVVDNLTVSSHYASAAEDGSDTSSEPRRMSLGPSGEIQDPASTPSQI
ncbi:hypothetical protein PHMEG_00041747 [Phytophthora megakarya]|uniref:Uncharacterized protein n=1 Tax=Phytophthora megakarya TaxID=4795 RepID=A0A225UAU3_9STRA|nr:hypothetical protein PHMEG_00041747 [Phytophthora megakarya]